MKKILLTSLSAILVLAAVIMTLSLTVWAAGVTEIKTVADLKAMTADGNYKLANSLTLTEAVTIPAFSGSFDGNGKTISGLSAPLFKELSGSVKNLTLKGSITSSSTAAVGALAATVKADLTVSGVTADVAVTAASAQNVGGLVGEIAASSAITVSFDHVTNQEAIAGKANVGGIVGSVASSTSKYAKVTFRYAINEGAVSMTSTAANIGFGGIVGFGGKYSEIIVEYTSNKGNISSKGGDNGVGGIYGGGTWTGGDAQKFTARYTSNYGNVTVPSGRGRAGGICGRMNRNGSAYLIEYCYNVGTISAKDDSAAGIFSYSNSSASATIRYSYNAGTLQNASRIFPIAGHGAVSSVVSSENYFVGTKTNYSGENLSAVEKGDKAALNAALLAIENSPYIVDPSKNNGYAIFAWECAHGTTKDTCIGTKCTVCGVITTEKTGTHSYGAWVTDKEATEFEDGEKHRTCSKCGDIETAVITVTTAVTPVGGIYEITTAGELVWLFDEIEKGKIAADITLKLKNDIDVKGALVTLNKTFVGTLNGNGKTLSGISKTLFNQFDGACENLTLRGDIDYSAASNSFDVARKAASFAHNTSGAILKNVISYVNVKTSRNDLNAGGLVGYAKAGNSFIGCAYNGTYTAAWTGDGAGIGGIVGWSNSSGGTTTFENCTFGGKITVTGGAAGKEVSIGGILGNLTNARVVVRGCISNGTIENKATSGTDYLGGIVGCVRNDQAVIENIVNRSTLVAKTNGGGIVGGLTANTLVTFAANYGSVSGTTKGAILGTAGGKTFTVRYSADFSASTLKLSGTTSVQTGSFTADKLVDLKEDFSFGSIAYKRYNVGVVEKASGMIMPMLSTSETFTPYLSIRDDGATHAIRFVILTNRKIYTDSVTVTITFKDENGKTVKQKLGTLAVENSDYTMYAAVSAAGEKYFAANGQALFGCVIKNIPNGAWHSLEVTVTDTANGKVYMTPASISLADMQYTPDMMPDLSVMGNVSSATYNAGPGLMNDKESTTPEDALMKVISNTTAEKLAAYTKTLEAKGYKQIGKNTLDGDTYYTYEKYGTLYYLYHSARVGETRVIVDNASDPLSKIEIDYTKKAGDTTEFYQYSINYDLANKAGYDPVVYTESGSINCGMCYIIKLPDNSVIVIDGAHEKQSTAKSRKGLVDFLKKITKTPDGQKVKIAMWYFTHAHGDHVRMASDILNQYYNELELVSVAHNFTSYQEVGSGYDANTFTLKDTINRRYPDVLFHKLHTGEVLNMAGVKIEVVYTHEDATSASGSSEIGDYNSASTVLKITMDGKSIMLLGDISGVAENTIIGMHSEAYLKSDAVQAAHHCFNYLNKLYPMIAAKVALFPQSMFYLKDPANGQGNLYKYQQVMEFADEEYFAHKYTYKFTVENGKFVAEALPRYDAVQ